MTALRRFVSVAPELNTQPADGLADRVRTAAFNREDNRWRMHLTETQIASVAYGLYLYRLTGSEAEANRFARDYGVVYRPCPDTGVPTAVTIAQGAGAARAVGTVAARRRRPMTFELCESEGELVREPGG